MFVRGEMRIPKKPPDAFAVFRDSNQALDLVNTFANPEVTDFIRTANRKYLHWDKLRYQPLPDGITPALAWAAIVLCRMQAMQTLELAFYDLDSHLKYWTPPAHAEWLHRIDKEAGGLIGGRSIHSINRDDDRYLFSSLMEEAIASSQLEGATTTRKVAKKMLREKRRPRNRAEQMILNNYHAILEIQDLKNAQLTPELMCHLQEVITENSLDDPSEAGRFRTAQDHVTVVDTTTGDQVLHAPPNAHTLEFRIDEICEFANTRAEDFIHPVVKAVALHFAVSFVHPFVDGNGRTARAVFYWFMLKSGYWIFEYLPISRIFLKAPAKYARAFLYTETDGGDLTYFLHYHLGVIIRALRDLHQYLADQEKELREAESLISSHGGLNHRQAAVLYEAMKNGSETFTIRQHAGKFKVTQSTARNDLIGLTELDLLNKEMHGKKWVFYPVHGISKGLKKKLASPM